MLQEQNFYIGSIYNKQHNMNGYIYALIDPRDNIIKYIGQTRYSLHKRYLEHLRSSNYAETKNYNVYCWINELKNNQQLPLIKEIEKIDVFLLNEREKYWIEFYRKQLKNVTKGGDGIKYINKRSFSVQHRKNIGDSCRGNKHYNFGKPAINRKMICGYDINNDKSVKKYESVKSAGIDNNLCPSAISLCLINKRYSSGGYVWLYSNQTEEDLKMKLELCRKHPSNNMTSIRINQKDIETNKIINIFTSIKEAARSLKTSDVAIKYACCKSKTHIYKNFKWEFNK